MVKSAYLFITLCMMYLCLRVLSNRSPLVTLDIKRVIYALTGRDENGEFVDYPNPYYYAIPHDSTPYYTPPSDAELARREGLERIRIMREKLRQELGDDL